MRHRRVQAPINTIKHYVPRPQVAITAASIQNNVVVDAVSVASAGTNTFDVEEGALVKAIHIEYWLVEAGLSGTATQFILILEKVPANQAPITFTQSLALASYPNKKNVLFTSQGTIQSALDGSPAIPVMRNWILIPKGKQRMGLGDQVVLSIATVGEALVTCGLFTYKEWK